MIHHALSFGERQTKMRAVAVPARLRRIPRTPECRREIKERPLGDSFIWAADIQEEMKESLYIDAFHYTAPMSRRIARFIFDQMRERNLIGD